MMRSIRSLEEMPGRCPIAEESEGLGQEVHCLLHGRRNRAYKIYFAIQLDTPTSGTVRVFHVRHRARRALTADELQDLMDEFAEERGEE